MAFPTSWTRQHAIQSDPDKVSGTANLTDFRSLLTEANFNASVFSNSQGKEINSNYLLSDANLLAYYRFESDGSDNSGNGYNLTVDGSPSYSTAMFGNGLDLGTSNSTKYAYISNNLGLTGATQNITMVCRVKITTEISTGTYGLLELANNSSDIVWRIQYQYNSGTRRLRFARTKSAVADADIFYNITLGTSNFYTLVLTYDGTNLKGYVNGVLVGTLATSGSGSNSLIDELTVGCSANDGLRANKASAIIDDVAVFSDDITAEEVRALSTGGADLRFTTDEAGTNQIPHEVVNWDIDNSEAEVHVKIPTLSYNTATTIYVWSGNSSALPYGRELATFNSLYNDANLQGYWKMESGALTIDSSGNGNTLTNNNTVGEGTGIFGGAADFGTGNTGKYFNVAGNMGIAGDSGSLNCWIKTPTTTSAANHETFVGVGDSSTQTALQIFLGTTGIGASRLKSWVAYNDTSQVPIQADTWYMATLTYDGSTVKLYVNGVFAYSVASSGNGNLTDIYNGVRIGSRLNTFSSYADGLIDDVAIWDRALSADEIAGLYGSGAGVWGSSYKGVWHLQNNLADSSPNAYNLTNSGASSGATGKIGSAYDFERTESDYATISDASGPGLEITGSQTFRCWLKPESIVAFLSIMAKSTAATAHHDLYSDGSGNVVFRINGLTTNSTVTSSGTMSAGTNYMLTGVYDSTNSKLKVFINSTKTEVTASGTGTDTNGAFYLGRNGDGNYLDGVLDEVRVLNIALSDDWIATEYNNQNSPATFWGVPTNYTDELTDTITLADNISRGVTYNRGTVSAITLADNVDRYSIYTRNISTEGSNIILNPSFEDGNIDNWTLNGGGVTVVAKSSTYANSGTYSLRVLSLSPSSSPNGESDYTNVSSSTTYNLSFYCRRDISDSNATYRVIGYDSGDSPTDLISTTPTNTTAGSFVQVTDTFTTASDTVKIKVFLGLTISNGDVFFDDVSVFQEGSDTILVTDNIDYEYTAGTILRSLLSSLTITDNLDRQIDYIREQLSGLTATDTINRQQNSIRDLINTLTLADNIDNSVLSLFLVNLSSSLSIGDNIDKTTSYSKQLLEAINVAENLVRNVDYSRVLSGSITITDSLDFVNLLSRELTSALSIGDNLDRVLNINVTLSDGISLDDALDIQNTLNRSIESSLILGDNIDATIVLSRSLTSGITVADSLDFTFVINRDLSDTITLTDTIDRVARYIGKSIASIGEIDTIKPTIQGVEKTKGTTYKIDKDRPILYSIRKG